MKKWVFAGLLAGCLAQAGVAAAADWLAPEGAAPRTLVVGGKPSTYYLATPVAPWFVPLEGPGRLTCLVRLALGQANADTFTYTIVISEGDRLIKTVETGTRPSEWSWTDASLGRASLSRKFSVKLPEGPHRLRFELKKCSAGAAALRYQFDPSSLNDDQSSLYPVAMAGSVSILVKEKSLDYFLADSSTAVQVKVVGPTRLRVITRLAYTGTMKGPQKYGVGVSLDGQGQPTEALVTEKAITTVVENHPEWSVGESRTFYLAIPDGGHELEFRLQGTPAPAVALRFTIPSEDVGASGD
jgi:hypothetical protein